ncbi:hypothetical protein Sango_2463400 [Sesamum angolense]|uniref:Uncharacterized protein n=1 Tax=Sesamum angolense TaxID=2727404 RepID=A0AAE1W872_9LAMI|nr:hypothetical protein Sango_2463400 [Sesamum angolense]
MTLKHQKGRLSLDDLMISISIGEEHRNQSHKMSVEHQPMANLIVRKTKGFVETSYALRFFVIKSEIPSIEVNTIVEFRDAVFLEDVFPMKTGINSSVLLDDSLTSLSISEYVENMSNMGVNPSSTSLAHEESDEPKQSKRARAVKKFGSDFVTYNIEDDPITFKDVMASSKAKQWKEAVKK